MLLFISRDTYCIVCLTFNQWLLYLLLRLCSKPGTPDITPSCLWGSCCLVFSYLFCILCTIVFQFVFFFFSHGDLWVWMFLLYYSPLLHSFGIIKTWKEMKQFRTWPSIPYYSYNSYWKCNLIIYIMSFCSQGV